MPAIQVKFHRGIQDSQEFGSDDEHMVSRVFFSLLVDGKGVGEFSADVKQAVGTSYESGPLEVSKPTGYKGPFNYDGYRRCVETYYRRLVGGTASGIRISGGSNIRMRNNRFEMPWECGFAADARSGNGW